MEEQMLFTRIHDALDIEMPAGAYERLRTELTKKPVRTFRWPALQTRFTKMSFRFAAGLAIVAIAVAAAAAALAIHNSTNNQSPAGSRMSIQAYQKMVTDDNAAASATYSAPCGSGNNTGCGSDATGGIAAIQKWVSDISQPDIPLRFLVVNTEMRQVLMQNLTAQRALLAASNANDQAGEDRAFTFAVYAVNWTSTMLPAIASSRQVDAATYVNWVKNDENTLQGCHTGCQIFASPDARSCTTNGGIDCVTLFDTMAVNFVGFLATLTQYAAPSSLSTQDLRLQSDLAAADAVLRTVRAAIFANDQTAINSGIDHLVRLLPTISSDAAKITG